MVASIAQTNTHSTQQTATTKLSQNRDEMMFLIAI